MSENETLVFDPETHSYTLYGEPVPSVTQVLRYLNADAYAGISPEVLRLAAERGTRIHEACTELDFDPDTVVDADILPYVNAYAAFKRDFGVRDWEAYERMGWSSVNGIMPFAGTVDRIGDIGDERVIIDIKTGQVPKATRYRYWAQLWGYSRIFGEEDVPAIGILQLRKEGRYTYYEPTRDDLAQARDIWDACLKLHYLTTKGATNGKE